MTILKRSSLLILSILMCIILPISAAEKKRLAEISSQIDSNKGKELSLVLRLRNFDKLFEKITFYDDANNDISFDITGYAKLKKWKPYIRNIHEGAYYNVTFIVKDLDASGLILADLISFTPEYLDKLP